MYPVHMSNQTCVKKEEEWSERSRTTEISNPEQGFRRKMMEKKCVHSIFKKDFFACISLGSAVERKHVLVVSSDLLVLKLV